MAHDIAGFVVSFRSPRVSSSPWLSNVDQYVKICGVVLQGGASGRQLASEGSMGGMVPSEIGKIPYWKVCLPSVFFALEFP